MARTKKSANQRTLFSCFQIKKKVLGSEELAKKGTESTTVKPEKVIKTCRFTKTEIVKDKVNIGIKSKPKQRNTSSRRRSRQSSSGCQKRRSRKSQMKSKESKRTHGSPFKMSMFDFTLSTRETEVQSEMPSNFAKDQRKTFLTQDIKMEVESSKNQKKISQRKRKASQQKATQSGQKKRKTSSRSRSTKKRVKCSTMELDTNESTLSFNALRKLPANIHKGGIPDSQEFKIYDESDIFGTQMQKYNIEL